MKLVHVDCGLCDRIADSEIMVDHSFRQLHTSVVVQLSFFCWLHGSDQQKEDMYMGSVELCLYSLFNHFVLQLTCQLTIVAGRQVS